MWAEHHLAHAGFAREQCAVPIRWLHIHLLFELDEAEPLHNFALIAQFYRNANCLVGVARAKIDVVLGHHEIAFRQHGIDLKLNREHLVRNINVNGNAHVVSLRPCAVFFCPADKCRRRSKLDLKLQAAVALVIASLHEPQLGEKLDHVLQSSRGTCLRSKRDLPTIVQNELRSVELVESAALKIDAPFRRVYGHVIALAMETTMQRLARTIRVA
mmetsp:Transcript_17362/g.49636  ORF Transcript_17362/g.49636 Transcript_17362/m.49636 type:complete len:215 (-) Transcript_17362:669-1313(-)